MKCYLGIDCGGTITKAALYTQDGIELAVETCETKMLIPKPGFAERDMDILRESVYQSIRRVICAAGISSADISCIACCGHGKGLYLWGKDGKPVRNAILSADTRAQAYEQRWKTDGTEKSAFQRSLQQVMSCQPVALLNWLQDHEPETLDRTQWIFACKDYVRFTLTNVACAELTDYSGDNFVNLHTRTYDKDLLACFGLEHILDKLPPLCRSTDICGGVTAEAAAATGLLEGTPVAGGMFDIDACLLAVNAVDEARLCVIAGTWSINEYIRRLPIDDGSIKMNSVFCDPDYYLIEESSATSAGNNEWFIRTLFPELREQCEKNNVSVYDLCNEMVESIPAKEFSPIFLPFLFASNVHPQAKSCFIGMCSYHTRAHLIRGVYEGIAYCHNYHIDRLLQSRTTPALCIRLAGGVARSAVWAQMFADITQLPVETVDVNETGTLGCAITAAVAAGNYASLQDAAEQMVRIKARYTPNLLLRAAYRSRYEIYKRIIDALDPIWESLSDLL